MNNGSECLKWSLNWARQPYNAKTKHNQQTDFKFNSAVCYFSMPNKSTEFKAIVQVISLNS